MPSIPCQKFKQKFQRVGPARVTRDSACVSVHPAGVTRLLQRGEERVSDKVTLIYIFTDIRYLKNMFFALLIPLVNRVFRGKFL